MKDRYGREIQYLRISVTQKCNLKCIYCNPGQAGSEGQESEGARFKYREDGAIHREGGFLQKADGSVREPDFVVPMSNDSVTEESDGCANPLSVEEIGTIVKALAELGIKKVRLTGGEPLMRNDICDIVSCISGIQGIEDISMTTNGILLDRYARRLKEAGLMRLNISLDSLDREKFKFITGGGRLDDVLDGIKAAIDVGFSRIRINAVIIKGINDDEIDSFIGLTRDMPVDVRFIELMPIGSFGEENEDKIVYNDSIIASHPELVPCESDDNSQPARYFAIEGFKGRVGFISPMSHKFCNLCNRIRLTCDGKIKPCLGNNYEVDIAGVLRSKKDKLTDVLARAIYEKPKGHNFNKGFSSTRSMNLIGG